MRSQITKLEPHPGPQWEFSRTEADIAIFGGSAGPGKSRMLVQEATRHAGVPGFSAAIFRRTSPELTGPGSVWEEARAIYPLIGGMMREHRMDCRFPSGAIVQMAHCQYEDDLAKHQSKAYCYIGIDELTQFTERQFWFLLGRNRSTCGVHPYFRAATNPNKKSFVRGLIDWWIGADGLAIPERSGVLRWMARVDEAIVWGESKAELEATVARLVKDPKERPPVLSFTFISAKLEDNPSMMENDPGYAARLAMLPRVDRLRLKEANWDIDVGAGLLFQSQWFGRAYSITDAVTNRVRAWDKAGTEKLPNNEPAWTVGALWARTANQKYYVEHVIRFQAGPGGVEDRILRAAADDGKQVEVAIWQDPGQAGKADVENFRRLLEGYRFHSEPAKLDKVTYAKPVSSAAEHGNVILIEGHWNQIWIDEHEDFPDGKFKDQVDSSSLAHLRLTAGYVPIVGPGSTDTRPRYSV